MMYNRMTASSSNSNVQRKLKKCFIQQNCQSFCFNAVYYAP